MREKKEGEKSNIGVCGTHTHSHMPAYSKSYIRTIVSRDLCDDEKNFNVRIGTE